MLWTLLLFTALQAPQCWGFTRMLLANTRRGSPGMVRECHSSPRIRSDNSYIFPSHPIPTHTHTHTDMDTHTHTSSPSMSLSLTEDVFQALESQREEPRAGKAVHTQGFGSNTSWRAGGSWADTQGGGEGWRGGCRATPAPGKCSALLWLGNCMQKSGFEASAAKLNPNDGVTPFPGECLGENARAGPTSTGVTHSTAAFLTQHISQPQPSDGQLG